tara:strand:+ start:22 stop:1119 length:1098 start_codon:yes stop_codon:yes gene_type:complete
MNSYLPKKGTPVNELETPCIIIDLDIAEKNITTLQNNANELGIDVRPHAKTHKSSYWAKKQIAAGAIGVCCAKLAEAEVLTEGGINNILITNQIIGEAKITRLAKLAKKTNIIIAVENEKNINQLSQIAKNYSVKIGVIIEINVGMNRCGVSPEESVILAEEIEKSKSLNFHGIMGYEGHAVAVRDHESRVLETQKAMSVLNDAANKIRSIGINVELVSASGTGTYAISGKIPGITEVQCGSYIFMDGDYLNVIDEFKSALTVMSTVISKSEDRVVADFGLKSISVDRGTADIISNEKLQIKKHSEEHTVIESASGEKISLEIGDKIFALPMHGDTTINLHENFYGIRNGKLEEVIPISGRGKFL